MTVKLDVKKQFLSKFQDTVIQGRKLLQSGNHRWADRLLTELYFEIERKEWLDIQKKHQLIMIITNSWWMYLNSLMQLKTKDSKVDIIKYIDGYKRFFSFLSKLDNFYLFNNFTTKLLKTFIKMEDISLSGITKFINSFCVKVSEREEYLKLVELQILLMYIRKSVIPQEFYHFSMEIIGRTIFKIEPSKRSLFLYILLENINLNYQLMEDSEEFVKQINKILQNRLPSYLKNEFSNLNRMTVNERNFMTVLGDLEELIHYLNDIGESSWITVIIKNVFEKLNKYKSFGDAITYIRKFIDFSLDRNQFDIAFKIYDYLEELFMVHTDLGYDNILIELWVEASKKFVEMKEKKYLLQSLEKLNTHLKIPQTIAQIYHYFYTCNFLWQFKSMFFSLEQRDFWRMMFYRVLFEEQDFELANKIIPYLDKDLQEIIPFPRQLYNEVKSFMNDIYSFEDERFAPKMLEENFEIKQMILRIAGSGSISYRMISLQDQIIEGKIFNEYWNDAQIIELFNDIFSSNPEKRFNFSLMEIGKLSYTFLPRTIRNFFKQFQIRALKIVPEIFFILENMTIPFELIYDNNFFLLKYSIGYIIGEPPLGGVTFDYHTDTLDEVKPHDDISVLIIDCTNSINPLKWNESINNKELIFPFFGGTEELNYITNFFNNQEEIKEIVVLSGEYSTRNHIISQLVNGNHSIIHFVGNIFYSKWNPYKSFFLANDNEIVTFYEINQALKQNGNIHPFLFFNSQLFDVKGKKIRNVLRRFGDIMKDFDHNYTTGIIARSIPIFDEETQEISSNFYVNLLKSSSQGVALLKARQECISKKMTLAIEEELKDLKEEEGSVNTDLRNSQAISSFILYGNPWKKLN
ncbi:MAG: hypothetical protein KGD73_07350 [Candidatus Lokiarchaeota archaeon]|nr:hypothetical protein [Candidatus Lokiarchaeota archaeon]